MRETPPKPPAPQQRWLLWLASHAAATDAPRSWLSRYGVALGAVGVATVVRRLLDPLLADNAPYGVYLLAVLFVVWRAGLGPAVFTIFTGTLLGRYFFDAPRFTLWITTESNEAGYLMSVTIGFAAVVVSESLRVAAREYRRLFELARQSDARKDEFLATLAHELRNPLMPIRNATYLLGEIEPQNAEVARLQHTIERHTKHLIRLVNDLLDLSRITQRKIDLRRERVDLHSIFDDAVEAARPLMDEKRQEFHCSLPAGNITLEGDAVRLTQVVTNLLHNAAKYTGHEGRVWLSAELENGQAVIRVRDTGIGIPTDLCERIFGLFEQAHEGIENSQGGLGIGLTLVRELVERHGGTVEAHSPGPGLGSEFIVRLPGAESAPGVAPPALSPLPRGVAAGRALRIMIVDDSPAIVATLDMILRDWKHIVQICNDGFAALEAARSFQPDVVLADLGMPRMNGYDLARALRRMPALRDCILIAISGYGQQADMQRSREAGFVRHLVKPVELETLKAILGTLGGPFPDSGAQPQLSR